MNGFVRTTSRAAIAATVLAAWAVCPTSAQVARISVGDNVHVSAANPERIHGEVQVAADPTDPNHLLACSGVGPVPRGWLSPIHVVAYVTFDGGLTWQPTLEHAPFAIDPACALGKDSLAMFAAIGGPINAEGVFSYKNSYVYRSTDGGRTWSKPQLFPDGDRDFFSIDNVSDAFANRVYYHLAGHTYTLEDVKMDSMSVFHSANRGLTFSSVVPTAPSRHTLQVGESVVLTNGTLVAEMYAVPEGAMDADAVDHATIQVVNSTDGGASFSRAYTATDWTAPMRSFNIAHYLPSVAVDTSHGPYNNRVYIVWTDTRYGHGDVLIVHSDDAGKTWSKPLVADDTVTAPPGKGTDCYSASVTVNDKGVVGITWYDRRGITDGVGGWVRFAASTDGGETFGSSVRVSSAPSLVDPAAVDFLDGFAGGGGKPGVGGGLLTVTIGPDKRYGVLGADTSGLAADAAGIFHPLWADDRTGISQLWTARVTVDGAAIKNGDPRLSAFEDVTNDVALRFTNSVYDRNAHTIAVDVQISNTSKKPIAGPIALRIISATSVIGAPVLLDTENGLGGRGAIVSFQAKPGEPSIAAGAQTVQRRLTFRITNPRRLVPAASEPLEGYLAIFARAFAPSAK